MPRPENFQAAWEPSSGVGTALPPCCSQTWTAMPAGICIPTSILATGLCQPDLPANAMGLPTTKPQRHRRARCRQSRKDMVHQMNKSQEKKAWKQEQQCARQREGGR